MTGNFNAIRHRRYGRLGAKPAVGELAYGQIAINYADGKLYVRVIGQNGQPDRVECVGSIQQLLASQDDLILLRQWVDQQIEAISVPEHQHSILQIQGLEEALVNLQSAIAQAPTSIDRHPFKNPSSYVFTHFVGANAGEFGFGTSGGNGASAGMITGSTEGYSRIVSGTVANARGFVNSGLQSLRLGQTIAGQVDVFRCRAYLNTVQAANNYSVVQLGFMSANTGTPANGVFFQYDVTISPNWQCVTIDNNGITVADSLIPIDANINHDFQIVIASEGAEAKFYIDQNEVAAISTSIPKTSGREVGVCAAIVRRLGTSTHSFSIDHIGGGVRQSL